MFDIGFFGSRVKFGISSFDCASACLVLTPDMLGKIKKEEIKTELQSNDKASLNERYNIYTSNRIETNKDTEDVVAQCVTIKLGQGH